jgi:hypothetical protein
VKDKLDFYFDNWEPFLEAVFDDGYYQIFPNQNNMNRVCGFIRSKKESFDLPKLYPSIPSAIAAANQHYQENFCD